MCKKFSGFLSCFNPNLTPKDFVVEDGAELEEGTVWHLLSTEKAGIYAEEIWRYWAGDESPDAGDKEKFCEWLGPELSSIVLNGFPSDFFD